MPRVRVQAGPGNVRWPLVYSGIFLTTLATLMLELSLTRIFSVVFYYHFAFLAISIALFGLGVGGVLSYVVAARPGALFRKLGLIASLNGVAVVLSLILVLRWPGVISNAGLAVIYVASAAPFVLAGITVSLAISETIDRVDRVYFFDLLGAAAGCLLLIPLLNSLGGPNTVIAAGVLYASASAVWFSLARSIRGRILAVGVGLGLVWLVVLNAKRPFIDVRYAKEQRLLDERFVKWNSFSRIAIVPERNSSHLLIVIDGDASTGIAQFDFDRMDAETRRSLLREGPGLPYALRPGAKTLVIGPGGGWDVSRALASGSRDVTGVEINPIIANTIMRERFPFLSRRLYLRPEVKVHVEDGRSFVRRSREKYQVLQATLVDTWASTAAGAFALSENNLYTTDAFHDYLSHLTEDGILAFTRWGFEPPRESLRLITLATEALDRLGEKEAWRHFLIVRENTQIIDKWGATDTVLISRKPFSEADVVRAREIFREAGVEAVYWPGQRGNAFADYLLASDRAAFLSGYTYDVAPVDDDRPFFFYTVQPRDILNYLQTATRASADFKINKAVPLLFGLVAIGLAGTLVTLLLPPLVLRSRLPSEPGVRQFLLYFLCVGVGYILIQVALIQKFVLFLGHPTYALTVIIFSMLVASGAGSFASRRFTESGRGLTMVLAGIPLLVTMLAFGAPLVTASGIGWPLPARIATTVVMVIPAAFLMGMPFPSGLSRLEAWHKPSVRWAWSLNAAASVLGSSGAIFLALNLGLRNTLIAGGLMYLLALPASRAALRRAV